MIRQQRQKKHAADIFGPNMLHVYGAQHHVHTSGTKPRTREPAIGGMDFIAMSS